MDYKKTAISLIFLIVVAVMAVFVFIFNFTSEEKEVVYGDTVVLTDDGFSPKELTINIGDTVTFKSERGKFFWPASNCICRI